MANERCSVFGLKRDEVDSRDRLFALPTKRGDIAIPERFDLIRKMSPVPVSDQGQRGSCVWNALCDTAEFHRSLVTPKVKHEDFSRLDGYYWTRALEGTVNEDCGCTIRNAMKVASKRGFVLEKLWPYDESKWMKKPPAKLPVVGFLSEYQRVEPDVKAICTVLAMGYPIVGGIQVTDGLLGEEVARTGELKVWKRNERRPETLHAIDFVGYDLPDDFYWCRNSWSKRWGKNGYFKLPMAWIRTPTMSSDFWAPTKFLFPKTEGR
jgi:C1A family cysteine protease